MAVVVNLEAEAVDLRPLARLLIAIAREETERERRTAELSELPSAEAPRSLAARQAAAARAAEELERLDSLDGFWPACGYALLCRHEMTLANPARVASV
jgi:hypothetical protein